MRKILNPDAIKLAAIVLKSAPAADKDVSSLANLIEQYTAEESGKAVHINVRTSRPLLSILCWGRHDWELDGYEYHYDGSKTLYYRCVRCGSTGLNCTS